MKNWAINCGFHLIKISRPTTKGTVIAPYNAGMQKTLLICAFLFCAIPILAQDSRKMADSIRKARRVPSLVYAVVSADTIMEIGGVGYRQFRTKDTISLKNRYHIGSATAALTAYIAAGLVTRKKILWNTTLLKLFPDFARVCRPEFKTITLADLLSQQAGLLKLNVYSDFMIPAFHGTNQQKRSQFAKWVIQQKAGKDTSGKRVFRFSNANTAVAVAMLEKASGKSWEQLLQEYINRPMGINVRTRFPARLSSKEPYGHWNEGDNFVALDSTHWFGMSAIFTGACDANMTIGEYAKFIQYELRGVQGMKSLLPAQSYTTLHYSYPDYALGWVNLEVNGNHISESDGTLGTFFSHSEIIKEKNIAVITMCNSGDAYGRAACVNLARLLRQKYVTL